MLLSFARPNPSAPLLPGRSVQRWLPWLVALAVWLVAGFVVAFVVLRWLGHSPATAVPVAMPPPVAADTQAVARALGARAAQAAPAIQPTQAGPDRYVLTGVVAPVAGGQRSGVALIAIDGQRPSPYRVGAEIDGRWTVEAVERRTVVLRPLQATGAGAGRITLALPINGS